MPAPLAGMLVLAALIASGAAGVAMVAGHPATTPAPCSVGTAQDANGGYATWGPQMGAINGSAGHNMCCGNLGHGGCGPYGGGHYSGAPNGTGGSGPGGGPGGGSGYGGGRCCDRSAEVGARVGIVGVLSPSRLA